VTSGFRVLVVEDGFEYSEMLGRFLGTAFDFERAGDGGDALARIDSGFSAVFLDMRFDRTPPDLLLGDLAATTARFQGDVARARRFLEDNQGAFVLASLRASGCKLPMLFSHDFSREPRRWANLQRLHGPVNYLPDSASPDAIAAALLGLVGR
jgi:CheY-like chemotaxis protein